MFAWLASEPTDMTLFFRALAPLLSRDEAPSSMPASVAAAFYAPPSAAHAVTGLAWLQRWWRRARSADADVLRNAASMQRANPKFVLRNWLAQEAIEAAEGGDDSKVHRLLAVMERPYDEQQGNDDLAQKRPEWAKDKPGCSALSCSS